jgi:integrase
MGLWVAVLQGRLSQAVADELVMVNVASKLGKLAGRAAKPIVAFSPAEVAHLLKTCQEVLPAYHSLRLLLARTGLRLGEALALQAPDLDLSAQTLHICRNLAGDSTKSSKPRLVDMTPQLVAALSSLRGRPTGTDRLWPGLTIAGFHHQVWRPVIKASGLPYRKPHTLRHTYASLLLARGVSVAYVQAQIGHAPVKMAVDIYGHYIPGARERFVDSLDGTPDITPASPMLEAVAEEAH